MAHREGEQPLIQHPERRANPARPATDSTQEPAQGVVTFKNNWLQPNTDDHR
jgi:hypothetical protein